MFLDVVSAGNGGLDFRLDDAQLEWLRGELGTAADRGERVAVFMHAYPADLRQGADALRSLLAGGARPVLCVDMGHTHYNELANDGRTVFMTARSTGQIEEGPVGFAIAALDGDVASWRFKTLDAAWPFVLVTTPADRRLVTTPGQLVGGSCVVRAKVIGDAPIERVEVRTVGVAEGEESPWCPMQAVATAPALWEGRCERVGTRVQVRARDAHGRADECTVEPAHVGWQPPPRVADGSDRDSVGAWPERGILGTQLGPNRNGHGW